MEKRRKRMNEYKISAELIKGARSIGVLTGAGVSAESGVPTFRGTGGLWNKCRAEDLATPEAFKRDPVLVWKFYDYRRQLISKVSPNNAHRILAKWEKELKKVEIVTQNIDGLHQRAGSEKVVELHGNIWQAICLEEKRVFQFTENPIKEFPPKCPFCGGRIRPNVVWFGESLDPNILKKAYSIFEKVELAIVIGTSAIVYPAAYLPQLTKSNGGKIIEINPERTPLSSLTNISFRGKASIILSEINKYLD